jgi:hypothetical protein
MALIFCELRLYLAIGLVMIVECVAVVTWTSFQELSTDRKTIIPVCYLQSFVEVPINVTFPLLIHFYYSQCTHH